MTALPHGTNSAYICVSPCLALYSRLMLLVSKLDKSVLFETTSLLPCLFIVEGM